MTLSKIKLEDFSTTINQKEASCATGKPRGERGAQTGLSSDHIRLVDRLLDHSNPKEVDRKLKVWLQQQIELDLSAHGPAPMEKLSKAIAGYRKAMVRAHFDQLMDWVSDMAAETAIKAGTQDDNEQRLALMVGRLEGYPADIVREVCRQWPTKNKWWPTWFDLQNALDDELEPRMVALAELEGFNSPYQIFLRDHHGENLGFMDFLESTQCNVE